jgi:hypothetical protein
MSATATTTRSTDLTDLIADHKPFKNSSGSLTARASTNAALYDTGRMDEAERAIYRSASPTYVIYSYATPIAWHNADGSWYVTDRKYSATTGQHRSQVARAVSNLT